MTDPTTCRRCGTTTIADPLGAHCPECDGFTFPMSHAERWKRVYAVLRDKRDHGYRLERRSA